MTSRSFIRGALWIIVAALVVGHAAGGWYFSGELIEEGFVPDGDPVMGPTGDLEVEDVTYKTPLGDMDAFFIPADGTTWVIHVHGKGATPTQMDYLFAPLQTAGYSQLSITYRNDEGQPQDPSGYYQYGETEWEDIAGALEYAQSNGAESVVFNGFSTGAAAVLAFVYRNNLDDVKGVIFDAPNIDFGTTVDHEASQRDLPLLPIKVPATVAWVAKFATSLRIGVNWTSIDYIAKAQSSLRVPVLIHHTREDDTVPVEESLELAEAQPDLVRVVLSPGSEHHGSFDADPETYIDDILGFLEEVG